MVNKLYVAVVLLAVATMYAAEHADTLSHCQNTVMRIDDVVIRAVNTILTHERLASIEGMIQNGMVSGEIYDGQLVLMSAQFQLREWLGGWYR